MNNFKPFDQVDFDAFEEKKRRDSFYNEARLRVKRKLAEAGKVLSGFLPKKLGLKHRTSIHNPYSYNSFYVASQWVYFARSDKDRRALKKHLGDVLGKDLDPNYTHVLIVLEVDYEGVTLALRIHKNAWWDGQNLKKKCAQESMVGEFTELLNQQKPGFILSIHDWKREYVCGELGKGDVKNYFNYYVPGEHWLHLQNRLARTDELATSADLMDWCGQAVESLVPLYQFVTWSPENNYLFGQD